MNEPLVVLGLGLSCIGLGFALGIISTVKARYAARKSRLR